ncbi:cytochrome P450 [Amylocystis lapponica]|nr:cytochrome P450 [Amylocystis lapponica]
MISLDSSSPPRGLKVILHSPMVIFLGLAFTILLLYYVTSRRRLSLPPGPKPKMWTGNLHQIPTSDVAFNYSKLAKQYGPLLFLRVFTRKILVLDSVQAAVDLLDSRAAIYSDRPLQYVINELAGRKMAVFHTSHLHPRFKKYRKLLQSGLNPRAVQSYRPILEAEAHMLLQKLAQSPEAFMSHTKRYAVSVVLKLAYGYTVKGSNDSIISIVEDSLKMNTALSKPGRFLAEIFPIFRIIPRWFPFVSVYREADAYRRQMEKVDRIPYDWAKEQINSGKYIESFTSRNLHSDNGTLIDEEEDILRCCAGAMYFGGADTVSSAISSFMLLMILNPDAQKQAQAEIEQVIGNDRLPDIDDEHNLPYVSALIKEVLRWSPPARLGLPHRVTEDDHYAGYWIPKGTTILANIWSMTRNIETYPNPSAFCPERFLGNEPQLDPRKLVFGFGRRFCPGSSFAETSLFLVISNILATFDVSKALDENGWEIEPEVGFVTALTSHVKPFACRITLRSPDLLASLNMETSLQP